MKKSLKKLIWILLPITLIQCGEEDLPLTTDLIQVIRILDIANEGNASDLLTIFNIEDPSQVSEIRLILVPSSDYENFDSKKAASLTNDQFHTVAVAGADYQVLLPATLKDVNGTAVQNGNEYTFAILLLINGNLFLNENTAQVNLGDRHFLEGKYFGLWNDNIYTDFGISCELKLQAGKLRGDFFYSSTFSPCCGGSNDGEITIEVVDNVIQDFKYNQSLNSFMGGPCPGLYNGEGVVENFITLKIDFEGDDCEGPHTGGSIVLDRIE